MAKLFNLKIFTPEREFFDGDVEGVTAIAPDGSVMVLADHAPMVMPVSIGKICIKKDGVWDESVNSEGFMEVRHDGVVIFVQACERPDEIDARRAEEAKKRAEEHLRQKQSMSEYKQSKIALARAMARLQMGGARPSINN
ncbi:MAG: ATP synthase F1 subunit epsilon [Oscillospiraceae bacterium]|nr:ATP synthase F1 subunit epsilon [Oscillospiraceae bacterium]